MKGQEQKRNTELNEEALYRKEEDKKMKEKINKQGIKKGEEGEVKPT